AVVDRHHVAAAEREYVAHAFALERAGDDSTSMHHRGTPLTGNRDVLPHARALEREATESCGRRLEKQAFDAVVQMRRPARRHAGLAARDVAPSMAPRSPAPLEPR